MESFFPSLVKKGPGIQCRVSRCGSMPGVFPLVDPQEASHLRSKWQDKDTVGKEAQIPCLEEYFRNCHKVLLPTSLAQVYTLQVATGKVVEYFVKVMSNEYYSAAAMKNR